MPQLSYQRLKNILSGSPVIIGKSDYFHSAVLVPCIETVGICSILFQKRASHIRQGDEICFPGGRVDPETDKTSMDTAIRETTEELGIDKKNIHIDNYFGTIVAPMGAIVDVYIGKLSISGINECNINKNEVASIFTLPLDFFLQQEPKKYKIRIDIQPFDMDEKGNKTILFPAKELGLPRRYHDTWGKNISEVYTYSSEHGTIWGLTGNIIVELVKTIQNHHPLP